jgi:hypothetical protein
LKRKNRKNYLLSKIVGFFETKFGNFLAKTLQLFQADWALLGSSPHEALPPRLLSNFYRRPAAYSKCVPYRTGSLLDSALWLKIPNFVQNLLWVIIGLKISKNLIQVYISFTEIVLIFSIFKLKLTFWLILSYFTCIGWKSAPYFRR